MSFDTIVAYTYKAETLCPDCTVERYTGIDIPDMTSEAVLDEYARVMGYDRQDERGFDSGDFPKVVFADKIEPCGDVCPACTGESDDKQCDFMTCDSCGEALL